MKNIVQKCLGLALAISTVTVAPVKAETAKQLALTTKSIEMWSTGDTSEAGDIFQDVYQNHQTPDIEGGPKTVDLDEWKTTVKNFQTGFPNINVEVLEQFGKGSLVSTRWRFTGQQEGEYLGLAPTGKTVTWTGIQIDRFENGKIAETWVNWDMYSMFKELGLLE